VIHNIMLADDLGKKLCEALGIEVDQVLRLTIELEPTQPIRVSVEMVGDASLMDIDWQTYLQDAEIDYGSTSIPAEGSG